MASTKSAPGGPAFDPSILVAPDIQVQQQQVARQRALADALREQSLQETQGNGGTVSWTQGLARLLNAYVSTRQYKKADAQQVEINQRLGQQMRSMFGGTPDAPSGGQPAAPSTPQQPDAAPQSDPRALAAALVPKGASPNNPMLNIPGIQPGAGAGAPPMPDPMSAQAPPAATGTAASAPPPVSPSGGGVAPSMPAGGPQTAPQAPMAMPQGNGAQRGPWSLTGDPSRDMGQYFLNPEEYGKAVIENAAKGAAPTDMEITVRHAQQAMASGDYATAQALFDKVFKDNHIAPVDARGGSWTIDPRDGSRTFNPAAPVSGAVPQVGPDGKLGWVLPRGTTDAVAAIKSADNWATVPGDIARAAGTAAAQAQYKPIQVYNPDTGQQEYLPTSQVVGGGGGAKGVLNSFYRGGSGGGGGAAPGGGRYAAGPRLGQQAASETYGKGSGQAFLDIQQSARDVPQRVQSLRSMLALVNGGLATGPTAQLWQEMAEKYGLTPLANDKAFIFNKDSARYVAQAAGELGLNGSDQRLGLVASATPGMKMTPGALKEILPTMIGLEYARAAKAQAAANWAATRGPDSNAAFESAWRQNYDPRLFRDIARGPQAFANQMRGLDPQSRKYWMGKYQALKGMGIDFSQFAQ